MKLTFRFLTSGWFYEFQILRFNYISVYLLLNNYKSTLMGIETFYVSTTNRIFNLLGSVLLKLFSEYNSFV